MNYFAYHNIYESVEKFKNERDLSDDDIFMYAFPKSIKDEDSNKLVQKQMVILLTKDMSFVRVYVDGEFIYELFGPNNNFFIDLNNRNVSIKESDYF